MKAVNLGIAFLLELAMLAALAFWGFHTGNSLPVQLGLGLGLPFLVVLIWGRFMAPQSRTRLTGWPYLLLKSILFAAAAIALIAAGKAGWALIFVVIAVINQILLIVWKQETPSV